MTDKEKFLAGQFKPVTIQDDMMFGTVMADPEILQAISGNNPGGKYERSLYRFMRDVQPKS